MTGYDWKTVANRIKEIKTGKEYSKKKPHLRILDTRREQTLKYLEGRKKLPTTLKLVNVVNI